MKGGFDAWNDIASKAEVDQGIYLIEGDESSEELLALAYGLEEENRRFYMTVSQALKDAETQDLFRMLSDMEEKHKESIWDRYRSVSGEQIEREQFETTIVTGVLEHGKTAEETLSQFMEWIQTTADAVELAMALETDALDLYLRMAHKTGDGGSKKVFFSLAEEERMHLKKLATLFQRKLSL